MHLSKIQGAKEVTHDYNETSGKDSEDIFDIKGKEDILLVNQETSDGVCDKENGKVLLDDKETRGGKETDDQLNAEGNEQVHDDYEDSSVEENDDQYNPVKETDDQPSSEKDKDIRNLEDDTRATLKNPMKANLKVGRSRQL